MIYLFVLEDSFTGWRFTTRTEQLTKCHEPLQKMSVRLGACKIDIYTCKPASNVVSFVLCFGVEFLCCLNLNIFTFGKPSGRLLGAAHSAYDMFEVPN